MDIRDFSRIDDGLRGKVSGTTKHSFRFNRSCNRIDRLKLVEPNCLKIRIRRIKSAIAQRVAHAEAADVVASASDVTQKLSVVEENLYQVRNRSGQDPLNFPIKLNNRIGALGRSVSTGEARPTAAAYTVYRELSAQLDAELKRLEHVIGTDVEALNRVLAGRNLDRIRAE